MRKRGNFVEMDNRKKIAIISSVLLIIVIASIGIIFVITNHNMVEASNEPIESEEVEMIPTVSLENINFELSEKESTSENVKIKVLSKLEEYNLYYAIEPIEEQVEEQEQNSEQDIEQDTEQEIKQKYEKEENYILYQDEIEIEENAKVYFKYELDNKYSENPYILEINNINKEEIITEELENEGATEEELRKEKVTAKNNEAPYYIIVDYTANIVTIYGKDANNEYTVPVKAMVCSTGVATPRSGVYKLTTTRYKWRALFGGVYGQYAVKIVGNILFHSVPYLSTDNSTLEYWEYDKLGTSASAGCIRLTVVDALWIYNNCGPGTQVEFSASSSNPLGKPSAKKISSYQDLRGFDPTDPVSNNPWRNGNISNNQNMTSENSKPSNPQVEKPITNPEKDSNIETPGKGEDSSNPEKTEGDNKKDSENKDENGNDNNDNSNNTDNKGENTEKLENVT